MEEHAYSQEMAADIKMRRRVKLPYAPQIDERVIEIESIDERGRAVVLVSFAQQPLQGYNSSTT